MDEKDEGRHMVNCSGLSEAGDLSPVFFCSESGRWIFETRTIVRLLCEAMEDNLYDKKSII